MENPITNNQVPYKEEKKKKAMKRALLLVNCTILAIGNSGGPLLMRFYFLKGGKSIWLSSWLETGGWPFIMIPIIVSYFYRRSKEGPGAKLFSITPFLVLPCAVVGVLTGVDDYLYSYGVSLLPLSTSELIIASQLAFTAGFAYILVKQKFTAFTVNAVFLLSVGAVVLAFHTNSDRPAHVTTKEYWVGFFMVLGAAALYGFVLPLVELTYMKAKEVITYSLVMEMQMIMSFFATVFCTIGMLFNDDFKKIPGEAREYEYGQTTYYVMLVVTSIVWQLFFMGAIGAIFCSSSLLSGIIIATLLPVTECLAVVFYHEKFQIEKGLSLTLNLWGFLSYFYGELQESKKKQQQQTAEPELPH
ncbi:purine permease 3-like [Cornus florida]|uniref:purine permease 3-like n=1 Tax=Cornus florida TaxID=4283 RepID=UPI0028A21B7F|nr:purine permease 3-like [Cornus florida]